jgi:phospholipase/carboxylesterase
MLDSYVVPAAHMQRRRLMVVLHGLGDSIEGYRWLPEAMQLPWMSYLLVNAPDDYYGGFSWYDIYGDSGPGISRSRALLFELLDYKRQQGWPTEETVLFGFSQGCLMSIDVGLRYPHTLAGIVGVSGYVHEPETLVREMSPVAREQRFLITHGTQDPLIPLPPVRAQIQQLRSAGLSFAWHEFAKVHTIAGEQEMGLIRQFVCDVFATQKP